MSDSDNLHIIHIMYMYTNNSHPLPYRSSYYIAVFKFFLEQNGLRICAYCVIYIKVAANWSFVNSPKAFIFACLVIMWQQTMNPSLSVCHL